MQNLKLSSIFNKKVKNFVILDIDSTLVTTFQRNQVILDQFCKNQQSSFPEEALLLSKAKCKLGDYGYYTALERLEQKPSNTSFMNSLEEFWRKNFFSNDFLFADTPTEGAVQFVQKLEESNIPFVYLTGRHKESMWEGTLSSLEKLGFPINKDILILKKDTSELDEIYKSKIIHSLKETYSDFCIWLIDNEPLILHQAIKDHRDVNLIWFDSCHSGKMQPPKDIPSINSFLL
mgnify:CR=1 FL=1